MRWRGLHGMLVFDQCSNTCLDDIAIIRSVTLSTCPIAYFSTSWRPTGVSSASSRSERPFWELCKRPTQYQHTIPCPGTLVSTSSSLILSIKYSKVSYYTRCGKQGSYCAKHESLWKYAEIVGLYKFLDGKVIYWCNTGSRRRNMQKDTFALIT